MIYAMIPDKGLAMLTGPKCPGCIKLKRMLNELMIDFVEVDVNTFPSRVKRVMGTGIPQLYLDGELILKGSVSTIGDLKGLLKSHGVFPK